MEANRESDTRCSTCVWWVSAPVVDRDCPYRAATTSSNAEASEIVLGRCSHHLALAPLAEVGSNEPPTSGLRRSSG